MFDQTDFSSQEHHAVAELAQVLFSYGQFERALSLLPLADWLSPGSVKVSKLRVLLLTKLERWNEALDIIMSHDSLELCKPEELAEIYWNLGKAKLGDQIFVKNTQFL